MILVRRENKLNPDAYPVRKSAILQASDDPHRILSILQLRDFLCFAVSVAELRDENIEQNHDDDAHV